MTIPVRHGRASPSGVLEKTQGEFWMSKRAMNMQPLYIYCGPAAHVAHGSTGARQLDGGVGHGSRTWYLGIPAPNVTKELLVSYVRGVGLHGDSQNLIEIYI